MTPDEYCAQKTINSGSSFYYSFRFLPPQQRQAIMSLYAFCREVDDIVDEHNEVEIARRKLDWWRQEIEALYQDKGQHPVTQAMHKAFANKPQCKQYLLELIQGMEMDLDINRYHNFGELYQYCYRAASTVGLLAAEIFGFKHPETREYAIKLGLSLQLTNIIRDVREDASRNRIYLPTDELARHHVSEEDVLNYRNTPELQSLLAFQAQRAVQFYDEAISLLPTTDRYAQRTGLIMAAIYLSTLKEIELDGFQVMKHKIRLTPIRKLWIAWRTAWRERRYHKKNRYPEVSPHARNQK